MNNNVFKILVNQYKCLDLMNNKICVLLLVNMIKSIIMAMMNITVQFMIRVTNQQIMGQIFHIKIVIINNNVMNSVISIKLSKIKYIFACQNNIVNYQENSDQDQS